MTGERVVPGNLGISAYWTVGSNGWDVAHDPDTRKLAMFCQGSVASRTTALPGSPAQGNKYVVPAGAGSNPNEVAIYDNSAWVYFTPVEGMALHVDDEDGFIVWESSRWWFVPAQRPAIVDDLTTTFTLNFISHHGKTIRHNNAAAISLSVPTGLPVGHRSIHRQTGAGQVTISGAGITFNSPDGNLKIGGQNHAVEISVVAADVVDITGSVTA